MLFVFVYALAACGSSAPRVEPGSSIFDGLDADVVTEVLANPAAHGKIDSMPAEDRASLAQAIVRNFIQCRGAYNAYRSWLVTGERPEPPVLSVPTTPIEPGNATTIMQQRAIANAIDSGDPGNLKRFLTGEATCGEWIPAEPGNPSGSTIEDEVLALG